MPIVLTLDLGTSATKAALWDGVKLLGIARAPIATTYPGPERAEQDPRDWIAGVRAACGELARDFADALGGVSTVACSAARETFALFDAALEPLGPAVLWSDRRGDTLAIEALGDPVAFHRRTGVVLNAACAAAKLDRVARDDAIAFDAARWVLAPRDLVVAWLTGEVRTEPTLASRTGWWALDGELIAPPRIAVRLPPVEPSSTAFALRPEVAAELGLPASARVVLGAGDRACEVLGVGATETTPMVSWGTTSNLSRPFDDASGAGGAASTDAADPVAFPELAVVSRAADRGFLIEVGLSAGGAAMAWLARLTGHDHDELFALAATVEAGAAGAIALPWLNGARGPWFRADVAGVFADLNLLHGPAHLARALIEAAAFDVARAVELVAPNAASLALAGGGATDETWSNVLSAATGRVLVLRRHTDAASVGARLIAGRASGERLRIDTLNPVVKTVAAHEDLIERYRPIRARSDAVAAAFLDR